jgi:hypothetical protein
MRLSLSTLAIKVQDEKYLQMPLVCEYTIGVN